MTIITTQILSDAQKREIKGLQELANVIAGYDLFAGAIYVTSTYSGLPFHWCLKRIDEINGFIEPQIVYDPIAKNLKFIARKAK